MSVTSGVAGNPNVDLPVPAAAAIQITGVKFQINNAKLYVPDVTLSMIDKNKFKKMWSKDLKEQFLGIIIDLKYQHNQETTI